MSRILNGKKAASSDDAAAAATSAPAILVALRGQAVGSAVIIISRYKLRVLGMSPKQSVDEQQHIRRAAGHSHRFRRSS